MPKFIVNAGTDQTWEIPLIDGTSTLGRNAENDFPIEHESVSSSHCQVVVNGDRVTIKDLGSTNGTFINDELVEEAVLQSGQRIRLGDVILDFESDADASPPIAVPMQAAAPSAAFCKFHPRSPARYHCPKCSLSFCELCVSTRPAHGRMAVFCRACSVECIPVKPTLVQTSPAEQSFWRLARKAFSYPLREDGIILLVVGGIFLSIISAAKFLSRYAGPYGFVAIGFLTIFGTGYLVSYLRRILTSSAAGEEIMPDWPEFTEFWSDILLPFLQLIGTAAFCFAPAVVLTIAAPDNSPWLGWVMTASIICGCIYFPLAFTAVAMFDTVTAVNPLLVIPSILKIPWEYLATIVLFGLMLLIRWVGETFVVAMVPIPVLPGALFSFISLYLLTVEMRILGLLYWTKKTELGWFRR